MSKPIARKKLGMMELTLWQGEYEGKPTYSYSIKKNKYNKNTKTWEDSNPIFINFSDIGNLIALLNDTMSTSIKKSTITQNSGSQVQQTPPQREQQTPVQQVQQEFQGQIIPDDDIPF